MVLIAFPVTGFVSWDFSHPVILSMSKIVPSDVQTGLTKGWRETAQKLKGRRLNVVSADFDFARPEPALAEYASSEAHSLCVICGYVLDYNVGQRKRREAYIEFVRT